MIKKYLENLFDKKEPTFIEWRTDDSIYRLLASNIDADGKLNKTAENLPDEKTDGDELKFASGLLDSMFGVEDSPDSRKKISRLARHLKKIAIQGDRNSEQELYKMVTDGESLTGIIDGLLAKVNPRSLPVQPYLFNFAKDLATKTDQRNSVKFGIAILGLCQEKSALSDIKLLGLHDEFTVYSAVAIGNLSNDVENDLWDLAQKVDGWGKIQVVDRLASFDLKEHIRDWLVLEGYKNSIMYEYLAFTCATYGELHKKLEAGRIDQNLFKSASDIIKALIAEFSPSEGISTYTFAAQVLQDFLRHSKTHAADIADFNALHEIKNYLEDLQGDIGDQKENGWNQNIISNCLIDLVEILNSRNWKVVAYDGLKSDNKRMFWEAKLAADKLGIDLWETVWEKLRADPTDSTFWSDVTNYSRPEHSDQIITFALTNLPFDELATGPRDGHGFGDDFQKNASLEYMTSFLEFYPKKGEKIILTALKSPVIRIRNMAIRVLDQWRRENWSAEIEKEVRHLSEIEPNQESKLDVIRLLNGEALSWEMGD